MLLNDGVQLSLLGVALLILVAFAAGWIDSVVGGGGLLQLPALLIGLPDSQPAAILGTNKLSSVWGTAVASITYAIKVRPDWRTIIPLVITSGLGAAGGAMVAQYLPKSIFTPIVLVALIGVGIFTWRRPKLGMTSERKHAGGHHYGRAAAIGLGIGCYDGLIGPGTGAFFVILLVSVLGYGFLEASAKARIANLTTNIGAIIVFGVHGQLIWQLGLAMGAANLLGGLLGARMAIRGGNEFVRRVFLIVVLALIVKLGYDTVMQFVGAR